MELLTQEDKKYLQRICRYLASLGMERGEIDVDVDTGYFDSDTIDLKQIRNFSNNYHADIPQGLYPILQKIVDHAVDFWDNDLDNVDYSTFNIRIDCEERSISSYQAYTITEPDDTTGTEWNEDEISEDETLKEVLEALSEVSDGEDEIEVTYEGSGDSGYIDDTMSNSALIPDVVQNWCYSKLESLHGGWEINEGSRGEFYFKLGPEKSVTLNHTYYIQESKFDTLWEEKF